MVDEDASVIAGSAGERRGQKENLHEFKFRLYSMSIHIANNRNWMPARMRMISISIPKGVLKVMAKFTNFDGATMSRRKTRVKKMKNPYKVPKGRKTKPNR
jgi:hypothetical protein